jgi:drug/metabolite transporter (DMT)-like permease
MSSGVDTSLCSRFVVSGALYSMRRRIGAFCVTVIACRGYEWVLGFETASGSRPMSARDGAKRYIGSMFIVVSAISFGAMPIFGRIAYASGVDTSTLLGLRFGLAAAVLLVLMTVRRLSFPRGRVLGGLLALGAIGYVGQSAAYFTAVRLAPVALVVLLLYLYPALVTVLAAAFLKERITAVKATALAVALIGTALTIGPVEGEVSILGVSLALTAAVIYAVYILLGSRLTQRAGAIPSATLIVLSATVVYLLFVAMQGPALPRDWTGWAAILALGLVSSVVSIVTFFAGLERVGPTAAATLSTLEPLVSVALGAAVLGEELSWLQATGGMLILVAAIAFAMSGETNRDASVSDLSASTSRSERS